MLANPFNFESRKLQVILLIVFPIFTLFGLHFDSIYFAKTNQSGQAIITVTTIIYFILLWFSAGNQLKKLMIVMVFLSYLGEVIFCKLLGWYTYRLGNIPWYVPLGHAIVFASGYILSEFEFLKRNDRILNLSFRFLFFLVFILLYVFGNDLFSLISGALFFLLLRRKRWQSLYFYIAFCVVLIELVGTYNGSWKWKPVLYGVVGTLNPPIGAVFFYAGGDVLLVKIVQLYDRYRIKTLKKTDKNHNLS
jgi:hypothetical protein